MLVNENLVIELDAPDKADTIHTNGDKLRGHVRVRPNARLNLHGMSIRFKGKITSRVDEQTVSGMSGHNTITHRAKTLLFDFQDDLPMKNALNVRHWPFEFEISWKSLPVAQDLTAFGPHQCFAHEPGFPLPPPTDQGRRNGLQEIKYYLELVGNAPTALLRKCPKNRLYIRFSPFLSLLTLPSVMLFSKDTLSSRETMKLDSQLASQPPSFAKRASRFLSSYNEAKPKALFTLHSIVPTKACPGDRFPITLSITNDLESSTAPDPPLVTFEALSACLWMTTDGRVPCKTQEKHLFARDRPAKWNNLFKYKDKALPLIPGEPLHLEDHLTDMVLPQNLEPGFRTYNASRFYQMKITATIRCMGKASCVILTKDVGKKEIAPLLEVLPKLKRVVRDPVVAKKPAVVNQGESLDERLEQLSPLSRLLLRKDGRRVKEGESVERLDQVFPWPPYDEFENAVRLVSKM